MKDEGIYTPDETYAMESSIKNIKHEADGRCTVSPLLRPDYLPLRNNYFLALQRYRGLWKLLEKDERKQKIYANATDQMIKNGEIDEVEEDPKESKNMNRCLNYLPHHGITKLDRLSTK